MLVVDSITGYGQKMGFSFKDAKYLATYTLLLMIISYLLGAVLIPKYISQQKMLVISCISGLLICGAVLLLPEKTSVLAVCSLGLFNAMLWPSIWPLALDGLGNLTKKISAFMIMGIVGGAITPLIYGYFNDIVGAQNSYWILIPCYLFVLFYAVRGYKIGKQIKVNNSLQ
ncbi:hypothetical protein [Niabella hirudinis]|uniref:hypothetical protein n=1 Tax=Niabella hirudinis TaxID=1285929 RepID=UPI003EB9CAE5